MEKMIRTEVTTCKNRVYILTHPLATVQISCYEYWPWQEEIKPVDQRFYTACGTVKGNSHATFSRVRNNETRLLGIVKRWLRGLEQFEADKASGKIITLHKQADIQNGFGC